VTTSRSTDEGQPGNPSGGREGDAAGSGVGVEAGQSVTSAADQADRTPTIEGLLKLRPETLCTLEEVLSVLDSIRLFRVLLGEASDRIKVAINREDGPTAYFTHGCGFLAGLEETDQRLVALEQVVRGVHVGAGTVVPQPGSPAGGTATPKHGPDSRAERASKPDGDGGGKLRRRRVGRGDVAGSGDPAGAGPTAT
jgi:hypothetical protein